VSENLLSFEFCILSNEELQPNTIHRFELDMELEFGFLSELYMFLVLYKCFPLSIQLIGYLPENIRPMSNLISQWFLPERPFPQKSWLLPGKRQQ